MNELFGELTPIVLVGMIPGLAQVLKTWLKLEGTAAEVLTFVLGFVLIMLYQMQPVLGAEYSKWLVMALYAVITPLSIMGYYKLTRSQ